MSFIAATATGAEAIASLERHLAPLRDRGEVTWRVHHDHSVAWTLRPPWVSSHDDGDVLVVVDGQLHNLWAAEHSPAESMYRRYRERGTELARGLLGDFVVIVLDRTRGALVVSRDPLGVRPWYQAGDGRRGAGATDIATLDALPWVNREVNER